MLISDQSDLSFYADYLIITQLLSALAEVFSLK